ncbi:MAG TPA: hypothetical protein VMU74_01795 [Gaiellaceae bacterium]|nr:hypothetical protein [Gaiellaceae bacterium]
MSDGMVYAKSTDPKRAILLGAMTSAYYDIVADEDRERVIGRFRRLMEEWQELGARVVATLDDDLFMVGEPGSSRFTFYLMFDVDDPQVVVEMIQRTRESADGIRMDRYVRFEAHVGRPFFLLEGPGAEKGG